MLAESLVLTIVIADAVAMGLIKLLGIIALLKFIFTRKGW